MTERHEADFGPEGRPVYAIDRAVKLDANGKVIGTSERARAISGMIDWYHARRVITSRQRDAAMRFERIWRRAAFEAPTTGNYGESVGGNGEMSTATVDARMKYRDATRRVGIYLCPIMLHVVCHDGAARDWAQAARKSEVAAIELLRVALDTLADHFGMPVEGTGQDRR